MNNSDGTTTGIRTCDKGNGFTISAPAANVTAGAAALRGRSRRAGGWSAKLSTGGGAEGKLEQRDNLLATAVFAVTSVRLRTGRSS